MTKWTILARALRVAVPGAALLQLSGCLSDSQITQIITSVVTTALSAVAVSVVNSIATGVGV